MTMDVTAVPLSSIWWSGPLPDNDKGSVSFPQRKPYPVFRARHVVSWSHGDSQVSGRIHVVHSGRKPIRCQNGTESGLSAL